MHTLAHWIYFLENISRSNFSTAVIGNNPHLFPLKVKPTGFTFLMTKVSICYLILRKRMSCIAAVLWLLNFPLCTAHVETEKLKCLALLTNPRQLLRWPTAQQSNRQSLIRSQSQILHLPFHHAGGILEPPA